MQQFYAEYQDNEILQPLVGEISWSKHLVIMAKCKDLQERQFYIQATKKFGWTKDVVTYSLSSTLPDNYKNLLPSPEEIASKLIDFNIVNTDDETIN